MKTFYRTTIALCLSLAFMFMILGTALADDSSSQFESYGGSSADSIIPYANQPATPHNTNTLNILSLEGVKIEGDIEIDLSGLSN